MEFRTKSVSIYIFISIDMYHMRIIMVYYFAQSDKIFTIISYKNNMITKNSTIYIVTNWIYGNIAYIRVDRWYIKQTFFEQETYQYFILFTVPYIKEFLRAKMLWCDFQYVRNTVHYSGEIQHRMSLVNSTSVFHSNDLKTLSSPFAVLFHFEKHFTNK